MSDKPSNLARQVRIACVGMMLFSITTEICLHFKWQEVAYVSLGVSLCYTKEMIVTFYQYWRKLMEEQHKRIR